jgi:hypothetical protein
VWHLIFLYFWRWRVADTDTQKICFLFILEIIMRTRRNVALYLHYLPFLKTINNLSLREMNLCFHYWFSLSWWPMSGFVFMNMTTYHQNSLQQNKSCLCLWWETNQCFAACKQTFYCRSCHSSENIKIYCYVYVAWHLNLFPIKILRSCHWGLYDYLDYVFECLLE